MENKAHVRITPETDRYGKAYYHWEIVTTTYGCCCSGHAPTRDDALIQARASAEGLLSELETLNGKTNIVETLLAERDAWIETARQYSRNTDYYAGLLDKCGETLGSAAYTQDDGGKTEGPLRAKIPELVAQLVNRRAKALVKLREHPDIPLSGMVVELLTGSRE